MLGPSTKTNIQLFYKKHINQGYSRCRQTILIMGVMGDKQKVRQTEVWLKVNILMTVHHSTSVQ
jgi:hypothetical protein